MKVNFRLCIILNQSFKFIICLPFIIVVFSCGMNSKQDTVDISGAYSLIQEESKGTLKDSASADINKIKIYTKDYYMYATKIISDSVTSFEIGTYNLDEEKLIEDVIFSSFGTTSYEPTNFIFDINKTEEDQLRIIKDSNSVQRGKTSYIENYKYIGKKSSSIVDGAWQQTDTYAVEGKDTIWDKGSNFKIMYDGYFIWGDFHMNSVIQKQDTYIGFGTFEIMGDSKIAERTIKSNWESNEGKTFYLDLEFINDDKFKQSILDSINGIRYIEVYQRLTNNRK